MRRSESPLATRLPTAVLRPCDTPIIPLMVDLAPRLITWTEGVLGARIESVRGLRAGGSPWLLGTGAQSAVMRVGSGDNVALLEVERAGLELAATTSIPVPRVLATHLSGDPAALLMEHMPGSSVIPAERTRQRLRATWCRRRSPPRRQGARLITVAPP